VIFVRLAVNLDTINDAVADEICHQTYARSTLELIRVTHRYICTTNAITTYVSNTGLKLLHYEGNIG